MKKFKVKYFLSNEIVAIEVREYEDAKQATICLGNNGLYLCKDENGISYNFKLSEVKMITAEEV